LPGRARGSREETKLGNGKGGQPRENDRWKTTTKKKKKRCGKESKLREGRLIKGEIKRGLSSQEKESKRQKDEKEKAAKALSKGGNKRKKKKNKDTRQKNLARKAYVCH